jgi:predicted phosphodiesterase
MKKFGSIILMVTITLGMSITGFSQSKIPVTDKKTNNAESTFCFAIVSDRTGGMRGGIFDGAMDKVEMLQPKFVISVGDLIDGYTEDPEVWNAQWDEFDAIIEKLSMPFYYVPGNYDTNNELLTKVWRERYGRDYYHFKYKDVLFLSLNTDEIEGGGIGVPQIEYFEKVLQENKDVKWILLFMHRPVWSYGDRMGYDDIEKALGDRNYTAFSGHHHNYRYKVQNGMEHFTLATTGGGSWMRNPDVGELDHITWVTMKEKGPEVAHIDINGIYGKNLVPEKDYEDIQVLRHGNWLDVKPFVNTSETFSELPVTFSLTNDSERTFNIVGELKEQNGIRFEPEYLEASIEKGTNKKVVIKAISNDGESSIADLNNTPLLFELAACFERNSRNDIVVARDFGEFLYLN